MSFFYELYRGMHLAEEERKERIHARLSFPAGIITLLAGVEAFYMQNAPLPHDLSSILFLGCAGVLVLGIARAVWFLFRALHDHDYAYIPSASAIEEHRAGLVAYYKAIAAENADASAEARHPGASVVTARRVLRPSTYRCLPIRPAHPPPADARGPNFACLGPPP